MNIYRTTLVWLRKYVWRRINSLQGWVVTFWSDTFLRVRAWCANLTHVLCILVGIQINVLSSLQNSLLFISHQLDLHFIYQLCVFIQLLPYFISQFCITMSTSYIEVLSTNRHGNQSFRFRLSVSRKCHLYTNWL